MTPDQWLDCCALWARIWPRQPLPPESVEPWYDLLADLDGADVRAALVGWAADPAQSWPPQSPGQLRGRASPADDWPTAIAALTAAVRRHGRWERPELPPALEQVVASFGGWSALCRRWDGADPTMRAQFRDVYTVVSGRLVRDATMTELAGGILPALTDGDDDDRTD